jgi:hypothetical protein
MSRQYPLVSHNYSPNCLLMIHSLHTMCIAEALAQGVSIYVAPQRSDLPTNYYGQGPGLGRKFRLPGG